MISLTISTTETILASSAPPDSETTTDMCASLIPLADIWLAQTQTAAATTTCRSATRS